MIAIDFLNHTIIDFKRDFPKLADPGIETSISGAFRTASAVPLGQIGGTQRLNCAIAGCPSFFTTDVPLSSKARLICKNHTRAAQLCAAGREFVPTEFYPDGKIKVAGDDADTLVHLQDHNNDKKIRRGQDPVALENPISEGGKVITLSNAAENQQAYQEERANNDVAELDYKLRRAAARKAGKP
jgi:hypothetical protein